jgi:regulator of telomere elongation helicase 1
MISTREGLDIWFPFEEPYPCQKEYMDKVIEALTQRKHALLESPTGTGKTICLLSACIAFMKNDKEKR